MRIPRPSLAGPRGDGSRRRSLPSTVHPAAPAASPAPAARLAPSARTARARVAALLGAALLGAVLPGAVLPGAALAEGSVAAPIDLLDDDVAGAPVCGAPAERLEAALGLPSHRLEAADGSGATMLRWAHLGVEAEIAADGRARAMKVQALPLDGLHGWRGTFLGPIASGTRREPVVRLLRGARTRLDSVAVDRIEATAEHGRLVVDFVEGWVLGARLACGPATPPDEIRAVAGRP